MKKRSQIMLISMTLLSSLLLPTFLMSNILGLEPVTPPITPPITGPTDTPTPTATPLECLILPHSVDMNPSYTSSYAGESRMFSVNVTNNSQNCELSNFIPSTKMPGTFWASISPISLTLAPGQTGTFNVQFGSINNTPSGIYPVTIMVAGPSGTVSDVSSYEILIPTSTPTATPTVTPNITPTPTPTVTPTSTPTVTPTATPTVTPTPAPSATPTATPTVTPTSTPTVTPTATPVATITPTATPTATPTPVTNRIPVITTNSVPNARLNRSYTASISGYDLDIKDNLIISTVGFPTQIKLKSCSQVISNGRKNITCTYSGTPTIAGSYTVITYIFDQKGGFSIKIFSLKVSPL